MENVSEALEELKKAIREKGINPTEGLPEDLFIFSTTLVPIVNVDLFIINENRQLLLSWRDDIYHGQGWHIPGGCLRLKERLEDRIIKTAEKEIGVPIIYDPVPIAVREAICNNYRANLINQLERCHNISFLYKCSVSDKHEISKYRNGTELRWFDKCPDDLLKIHKDLYGDVIRNYFAYGNTDGENNRTNIRNDGGITND